MEIKDGSKVCCLGDSLTEMGFWIYDINGYLADIGSKTRFYNCGIGGNMSCDAPYYLEDEVLKFAPDYVIVMFGANDLGFHLWDKQRSRKLPEEERKREILWHRKRYEKNMRILCQMLMQRNVRVSMMTPMPFDDYERETEREVYYGAFREIQEYGKCVKRIAMEEDAEVIELCEAFKNVESYFEKEGIRLYMDDRVHPNENGHKIMASIILKNLGYDIRIPRSGEELDSLPFRKTQKNEERFETERKLRELSFLERGRYNYENRRRYFLSWEEVAEDLTRRCFEGEFEEWESVEKYKQRTRNFILNRPRREEIERLLIRQTEGL